MKTFHACLILGLASCAETDDWIMSGRDPSRNAVSPGKNPPTDWSVETGRERNILWKARLGSLSFAQPVVADGLVWVGTNNEPPHDPARKEDAAVLLCFGETDGRFLWQYLSPRRKGAWSVGDGPWMPLMSSPLVERNRLWFVTNRWEVICLDIRPLKQGTGEPRELWRTNLIEKLGTEPDLPGRGMGFGQTCSIGGSYKGKLYVATGQGTGRRSGHSPGRDAPALVCLDADTGSVLGREASGIGPRSLSANWSSPVLARVDDERTLIVFGGGDGFLYGFDPDPIPDPEDPTRRILKEVWRSDSRVKEEKCGFTATPVIHAGRVYAGIGEESASGDGSFSCVDLKAGRILWNSREVGLTASSAVVADGLVLVPDTQGYIYCLDAETGRRIWRYDTLSNIASSPLLADGKLFVGTADAMVILDVATLTERARRLNLPVEIEMEKSRTVLSGKGEKGEGLKVADGRRPVELRAIEEMLLASPTLARGTLYVATGRWLYAIGKIAAEGAGPREAPKHGLATDAVFVPTPHDVVARMLEVAAVGEKDTVVDLGSGDGRIVIQAAKKHGCRAIGYELDRALVEESRENIKAEGLSDRVRIEYEDLLKADLSGATVITLYVGERLSRLLLPKLRTLGPGCRIVSHDYAIEGASPDRVVKLKSQEDKREHTLYLWTTPLKRSEK